MATPRALLIDPDNALCYHLVSRCVRHAWLCGQDKRTRRDYSYRKSWLEQRLSHLGRCFAVDIYAQAIMSNHFHLVVYFDPLAASRWSDEEVAERSLKAFPRNTRPQGNPLDNALYRQALLTDPNRLAKCRASLGSLSSFMQHLKQPIARRANTDSACAPRRPAARPRASSWHRWSMTPTSAPQPDKPDGLRSEPMPGSLDGRSAHSRN